MEALLVSIPDAAKALGVGRSKVYEMLGAHQLKTVNIGRRRMVTVASINAYIKDMQA